MQAIIERWKSASAPIPKPATFNWVDWKTRTLASKKIWRDNMITIFKSVLNYLLPWTNAPTIKKMCYLSVLFVTQPFQPLIIPFHATMFAFKPLHGARNPKKVISFQYTCPALILALKQGKLSGYGVSKCHSPLQSGSRKKWMHRTSYCSSLQFPESDRVGQATMGRLGTFGPKQTIINNLRKLTLFLLYCSCGPQTPCFIHGNFVYYVGVPEMICLQFLWTRESGYKIQCYQLQNQIHVLTGSQQNQWQQ